MRNRERRLETVEIQEMKQDTELNMGERSKKQSEIQSEEARTD